jgi:hypothetical protein
VAGAWPVEVQATDGTTTGTATILAFIQVSQLAAREAVGYGQVHNPSGSPGPGVYVPPARDFSGQESGLAQFLSVPHKTSQGQVSARSSLSNLWRYGLDLGAVPSHASLTGNLTESNRNMLVTPLLQANPPWNMPLGLGVTTNDVALGYDGTMTAASSTDASGIAVATCQQLVPVTADHSTYYCFSCYVPKTVSATSFPALGYRSSPDTLFGDVCINTNTGVVTNRTDEPAQGFGVVDAGSWWRVYVYAQNAGLSQLGIAFAPCFNTDGLGDFDLLLEGSAIWWGPKMELGTVPT